TCWRPLLARSGGLMSCSNWVAIGGKRTCAAATVMTRRNPRCVVASPGASLAVARRGASHTAPLVGTMIFCYQQSYGKETEWTEGSARSCKAQARPAADDWYRYVGRCPMPRRIFETAGRLAAGP